MVFNTSKWLYNTTMLGIVLSGIACQTDPTPMPTEELVTQTVELDPVYQLIYDTHAMRTPDSNQQRVRILLWLNRMNCNLSQLQKLDDLRNLAAEKYASLQEIELREAQKAQELYTPLFNQLWDSMRTGSDLSDPQIQDAVQNFQANVELEKGSPSLDIRLETIKSILDAEDDFLRSLSPEQESTIVDALYFLRYKLDPIGNPKDFSLLIGNTFEPGQYAILLKGTSELAQQSGNIGGLWSDQPELTGRVLHEAKREVVLYLILLEPALEEAIRAAIALQTQSNTP